MSERGGLGGLDEPRLCASGLHRDGSCSCGSSFMGEDIGPLGSISRVVLLAQALSEVLDEIHRQPLSLSMPMLSLPAPESVVDSFLLKSHKKMENGPNYVQHSVENLPPTSVESISSAGVASSLFGSEPVCTSSSKTSDEESESCNSSAKNDTTRHDSGNNSEDKASTSYESQPIQESASGNYGPGASAAFDSESAVNERMPASSLDNTTQTNIDSDENSGQNRGDIVRSADSDARALLVLSDSFLSLRMFGSGLTPSGPSDVESDMISGRILLVDTSELNSREARRNSWRLFGPTSLRNSSRRGSDFPSLLLATGLVDDLGSRDRWLLDISGRGRHADGFFRNYNRNERRRHFRSQVYVCKACIHNHTYAALDISMVTEWVGWWTG
nr:hypothetical protein [Tanacetum cinerariifolium]